MVCRWQYTSSMYVYLSTRNLLTLLLKYVIIGHNGWLWYVDGNILQVCMLTVNAKSSYTFVGVCYYWVQWLAMVCRWQYTSSMYVNCQREIFLQFCWSVLLLGTMVGYGM